jgi:hypothetical protein
LTKKKLKNISGTGTTVHFECTDAPVFLNFISMAEKTSKNRKSESAERFDEADNAGRFAGNDADAQAARQQAIEEIRMDSGSTREERNGEDMDHSDAEARRDGEQAHDYKGESQNVNDDTGRPLNESELSEARNKANEGLRQERNRT